jgi:hypothetical protein
MATGENQTRKRLKESGARATLSKTVVTGMQTELRTQIIVLLNERAASRPEICRELGASFNKVRHEIKVLMKLDPPLVEQVSEKPVRGTVEKFFRATSRAYLDPSEWPGVPDAIKEKMRAMLLEMIVDDAVAAISQDYYDSLENAHMSWTPMILDEQGWEDVVAILLRAMKEAIKVKNESAERLIDGDAEGISCTVSILGYPSANDGRKVGPSTVANENSGSTEMPVAEADSYSRQRTASKKAKATGKSPTGKAAPKPKLQKRK